jgi:hypothetical protein
MEVTVIYEHFTATSRTSFVVETALAKLKLLALSSLRPVKHWVQ